jgi:predicted Rossmann-fold nucleotide-binding protein
VKSLGLAMSFIGEEPSADVHKDMRHFNCFFDRMNTFEAEAALTASVPGGIGTLMELTNIATKLDTQNTPFPMQRQIVLFDKDGVFKDFIKHLDENFIQRGLMGKKILDIFKVVDEHHIEDGVALLKANQSFTAAA